MVPGIPCIGRGNWGRETQHCSPVTEFGVLKVLASITPYMFILHTKMSIFFQKGRSLNYILQNQPGKLMLETISSLVGFLVGHGKNLHCVILRGQLKLQLCGELCGIIEVHATDVLKYLH